MNGMSKQEWMNNILAVRHKNDLFNKKDFKKFVNTDSSIIKMALQRYPNLLKNNFLEMEIKQRKNNFIFSCSSFNGDIELKDGDLFQCNNFLGDISGNGNFKGTWRRGTFTANIFDGIFENGVFAGKEFNGRFLGGLLKSGKFNGTFMAGEFDGGTLTYNAIWVDSPKAKWISGYNDRGRKVSKVPQ